MLHTTALQTSTAEQLLEVGRLGFYPGFSTGWSSLVHENWKPELNPRGLGTRGHFLRSGGLQHHVLTCPGIWLHL